MATVTNEIIICRTFSRSCYVISFLFYFILFFIKYGIENLNVKKKNNMLNLNGLNSF